MQLAFAILDPDAAAARPQIGFTLGSKVSEGLREGAERLAGAALIAIAGLLLLARLVRFPI